jgi:hypothetical protein
MGNNSASQSTTLGDRLRGIAEELRQETDMQIKATSRILGAAAQMAQNHDRLIGEVVDMVEEDLDPREQSEVLAPDDVSDLKKKFKTLKVAKAHFGIKANSWEVLITKLNERNGISVHSETGILNPAQNEVLKRLSAIEQDMKSLQGSIEQVVELLREIAK